MKKRLIVLVALPLLLISAFLAYRLLPESSSFSRGQDRIVGQQCVGCHLDPSLDKVNESFEHPDFTVAKEDALAYFEGVRLIRQNQVGESCNWLVQAEELVAKYHCFICHGPYGQGGHKGVEGSLKGYVPGWFGRDFDILTQGGDPDVIAEWITTGRSRDVTNEFILGLMAEFFLDRQVVNMIAFEDLSDDDLELLVRYVQYLRQYGPMTDRDFINHGHALRTECNGS